MMNRTNLIKILAVIAAVAVIAIAAYVVLESQDSDATASYTARELYNRNGETIEVTDSSVSITASYWDQAQGAFECTASPSSFTLSSVGSTRTVSLSEYLNSSLYATHTVTFKRIASEATTTYKTATKSWTVGTAVSNDRAGSGPGTDNWNWSSAQISGSVPGITVSEYSMNRYQTLSFSGTPTTAGTYTVTGTWTCTSTNGSTYQVGDKVVLTVTITVSAAATNYTCYLYYNANGGSGAPSTQSYTGTSTSSHSFTVASGTPTRSGYDFLGWSTSSSATSASYSAGSSISVSYNGSKTLYAVWKEQVSTYQVTVYKGNWQSFKLLSDGTTYTSSSHTYVINAGQTIDVDWYGKDSESGSGTNYTYTTTYTAHEYQMASSLYGTSLGDSVTVNGNASYYPASQMQSTTAYTYSYTISYNANGGSGAPGNTTDTGSSTSKSITLSSSVPTWSGHQFLGWSTSSSATTATYSAGGSYTFNYGTTTLYAVWKEASLSIGSVSKQYAVVGQGVSFGATCTPSNVSVSYASSNASSGLTVSVSGSNITCNANTAGTYTFTLTASASGYTSSSTIVTVQFVPVLAFTNAPSIGVIGS